MKKILINLFIFMVLSGLNGCTNINNPTTPLLLKAKINNRNTICYPMERKSSSLFFSHPYDEERGLGSWYGKKFHKKRTSSGERYNMYEFSAAHKTLPLSSYALVTNLKNGREVIVKVNDRGPFVYNRIIDLSYAAAKKLKMLRHGTAPVKIKKIICV